MAFKGPICKKISNPVRCFIYCAKVLKFRQVVGKTPPSHRRSADQLIVDQSGEINRLSNSLIKNVSLPEFAGGNLYEKVNYVKISIKRLLYFDVDKQMNIS